MLPANEPSHGREMWGHCHPCPRQSPLLACQDQGCSLWHSEPNQTLKIWVHLMPEKTQAVFLSAGGATRLHAAAGCADGSNAPHLAAVIAMLFTYLNLTLAPFTMIYLADHPLPVKARSIPAWERPLLWCPCSERNGPKQQLHSCA